MAHGHVEEGHGRPMAHHPSITTYTVIFIILLVLLVITVAVAYFDFGHPAINLGIALLIATVKAVLILLYFMHVKYGTRLLWVFAGGSFVWLVLLFLITMGDYWTRDWQARPADQPVYTIPR